MKFIYAVILTTFSVFTVFSQTENNPLEFNFGFEKVAANEKLPDKWSFGGGYNLKIDSAEKKSGNNSVLIESPTAKAENSFGAVSYTIPANYEGKEIELHGFLKFKDVSEGFAGLWLRIDGDSGALQFDNMQSRGLNGSVDWNSIFNQTSAARRRD